MSFYLKPTDGGEPIIVVSQVPQKKLQEVSDYGSLNDQETTLKMQQLDCRQKIQVVKQARVEIQKGISSDRQILNLTIDKLVIFLTKEMTKLEQINLKKPTAEGQNLVEKIKGYISSLGTAKNPKTDDTAAVKTINTTQESLQTLGAEIQKFQQSLNRK